MTNGRHAIDVSIKKIDAALPIPSYAHVGDAGLDLYAATEVVLEPFARGLVPTGVAVAIPEGYAGFVQPKSGRAINEGLALVNSPGLIDAHYRGEIKVIVVNLDATEPLTISRGQKVAQMVIMPIAHARLHEVDELDDTARSAGGFGSTGV
jgi:dUTP pyrophosphatase